MTTRSETIGTTPSAYFRQRTSSGNNGKYETVGGVSRAKWNNYSLFIREETSVASTAGQYANMGVGINYATVFSANDQLRLLSKLSSKARSHDFNLAVNVAQGKQTVGMVVDLLKSMGLAALDARRGNFPSAIRRFNVSPGRKSKFKYKDISSRWLELQYGWLPAMGDSYEALLAYQNLTQKRTTRFTASITVKGSWEASASPGIYKGPGFYTGSRFIRCELTESISAARTLGLTDPLSVVWEVIPWSFCIDWFLPVGSYLENLNVIPKLVGRFLQTDFIRGYEYAKPINDTPSNIFYYKLRGTSKPVRVIRSVTSSLSVPSPRFISLADAMSTKRIYNALALAHQRFRVAGLE